MKHQPLVRHIFIGFSLFILVLLLPLVAAGSAPQGEKADKALRSTLESIAFNYAKFYEEGDVAGMESLLHPRLSKSGIYKNRKGDKKTSHMNTAQLLKLVKMNAGKSAAQKAKDLHTKVTVLNIHGDTANLLLEDDLYVEYLQLIKVDTTWKIIHVLWTTAPAKKK
ncbi:MAG: nuclear transport factor 2 family protein [bacterium]|nr:nuclear transport factor 2 family protein [bacterium]